MGIIKETERGLSLLLRSFIIRQRALCIARIYDYVKLKAWTQS